MFSMSLPSNYSSNFLSMNFLQKSPHHLKQHPATTTSPNNVNSAHSSNSSLHIKQELVYEHPTTPDTRIKSIVEDNDEKFSRLKLSSPLSVMHGSSSSNLLDQQQVSPGLDALSSSIFGVDSVGNDAADIDVIASLASSSLDQQPVTPNTGANSSSPLSQTNQIVSDANTIDDVNTLANELKISAINSYSSSQNGQNSGGLDEQNLFSTMNANSGLGN